MKIGILVAIALVLAGSTACVQVSAQAQTARIVVVVDGDNIASNQILFDYAISMEFGEIESLARSYPTDMIPYAKLIPKLPSPLKDWTADEPTGVNIDAMGLKYAFAQRTYHKTGGEDKVSVVIWDTVNQTSGPWGGWWLGYCYETPDT